MTVVNLQNIDATVWIPPAYLPNWKITIVRLDGTVDDITSINVKMRVTNAVTDGIGVFEVEFLNSAEEYTGLYTGMEDFYFYCDYAATSTTPHFKGKVEQPSFQNNMVRLSGRRSDLFLADAFVTGDYIATDAADILREQILLKGGGRFTTNGIVASTGVALTISWSKKPWMEFIKDLTVPTGHDYYVDATDDAQFFPAGSRVNTEDAIVHDFNLVDIGQFFPDVAQVKNRVRVTGADVNGVQVVYTAGEATNTDAAASQTLYGVKELNVQDNNLTILANAQQYGDYLLLDGLNPPVVGEVKSLMLATLEPGQSIPVSSPANGIFPSNQNIVKIVHEIDDSGIFTTATINKNPRQISQVLRKRVESENLQQKTISNLFNLDFSYPFTFTTVQGTSANTSIDTGVLYLSPGVTTGTWISPTLALSANLYAASVAIDAQTKTGVIVEISGDGGITYETLTEGLLLLLSTAVGSNLAYRITITDAATQVAAVAVYYSLQA